MLCKERLRLLVTFGRNILTYIKFMNIIVKFSVKYVRTRTHCRYEIVKNLLSLLKIKEYLSGFHFD
jgi:hypothetical protein